ncbi:MAG: YbaB/EbfC family nucleoid-associated protein [Coriobacteriales bacterium]|jgi:DNA-binding YbaB/EbfC family protein
MAMDMNRMMKEARKMQAEMERTQAELEEREFTATAGGGAVEATVKGSMRLVSLKIDPEAVDPEDVEMLEDIVIAAVNEAMDAAATEMSTAMNSITGGLNIPGLM